MVIKKNIFGTWIHFTAIKVVSNVVLVSLNIKKEIDDMEHKTERNSEKQVTVYGYMFIILKNVLYTKV